MTQMNPHLRFLYAIFLSLLVHITLVIWMQQHKQFREQDEQGILQVTLQHLSNLDHGTSANSKSNLQGNSKTKAKQNTPSVTAIGMPDSIGLTRANPISSKPIQETTSPSFQQNQYMIAMKQVQLAQHFELLKEASRIGLTNLTIQLRPLISESLNCMQQTVDEFECHPTQNEEKKKILKQFFDLAIEAKKFGIVENPLRLDLGSGRSITTTLLP